MDYGAREKYRQPGNVNPSKGHAAYEAGDERHRTKGGLLDYAQRARQQYKAPDGWNTSAGGHGSFHPSGREKGKKAASDYVPPAGANRRSVWTIPTQGYPGTHFATFPEALVEPCILAGSRPGDIVFDPFMGSGTVASVAQRLGRRWLGAELNPEYIALQAERTRQAGLMLESQT